MSTSPPPDPPPPLGVIPSRARLTGGTLDTRVCVRCGARWRVAVVGRVADGCGCGALEGRSRLVRSVGVIVGRVQADTMSHEAIRPNGR
jgi:hypothetical protein